MLGLVFESRCLSISYPTDDPSHCVDRRVRDVGLSLNIIIVVRPHPAVGSSTNGCS